MELAVVIPDWDDRPFHDELRTVFSVVDGLSLPWLASVQAVAHILEVTRVGPGSLKNPR